MKCVKFYSICVFDWFLFCVFRLSSSHSDHRRRIFRFQKNLCTTRKELQINYLLRVLYGCFLRYFVGLQLITFIGYCSLADVLRCSQHWLVFNNSLRVWERESERQKVLIQFYCLATSVFSKELVDDQVLLPFVCVRVTWNSLCENKCWTKNIIKSYFSRIAAVQLFMMKQFFLFMQKCSEPII